MLKQTGLRDHLYGYALERFDVVKSSICNVFSFWFYKRYYFVINPCGPYSRCVFFFFFILVLKNFIQNETLSLVIKITQHIQINI